MGLDLISRRFSLHRAAFDPASVAVAEAPGAVATAMLQPSLMIAQPVSSMILRSSRVATVNPEILHFLRPDLLPPIPVDGGSARGSFALPTLISPVPQPDDTTVFEAPADPGQRFFLPHYALAATTGTGGRAKWVALVTTDHGFALTVHLTDATNQAAVAGATRLDADTRYMITAQLSGRVVTWDLTVSTANDGAALKLELALTDFASRDGLYAAMTDPGAHAALVIRRSVPLALPTAADASLYHAAPVSIDTNIDFLFNRDLDASVFAAAGAAPAGAAKAWNVVTVNWHGRQHSYFQSRAQADQVFFLPDAFKVVRQDKPPHAPALSVTSAGDTADTIALTLSYLAQPVWDPQRIADAAAKLQPMLSLAAPPNFAVFEAADAKLVLTLPVSGQTSGTVLAEQPDAIIDIAAGIRGAITLDLAHFRQIFDALFDQVSPMLAGEVRIIVEGTAVAVPFIARANDFVGEVLHAESTIDAKHGALVTTLTNAIESPVRINGLDGSIAKGGTPIRSKIGAVLPTLPVTLSPAPAGGATPDTLSVTLTTAQGDIVTDVLGSLLGGLLGGGHVDAGASAKNAAGGLIADTLDSTCTPLFDFSKVEVLADPAAIWRAVMQNRQLGPVTRMVSLRTIAAMLKAADPSKSDAVLAIQVVFESGQTATFDASLTPDAAGFVNATIKLSVPMEAYILGTADTGSYRYRIDRVTPGGMLAGPWISDNRDVLFVTSAR